MKAFTKYQDFLVHHGRPGQRWGVRNGPPYPLRLKGYSYGSIQKKKIHGFASLKKMPIEELWQKHDEADKHAKSSLDNVRNTKTPENKQKAAADQDKTHDTNKELSTIDDELKIRSKNQSYSDAMKQIQQNNRTIRAIKRDPEHDSDRIAALQNENSAIKDQWRDRMDDTRSRYQKSYDSMEPRIQARKAEIERLKASPASASRDQRLKQLKYELDLMERHKKKVMRRINRYK